MLLHTFNLSKQQLQLSGILPDSGAEDAQSTWSTNKLWASRGVLWFARSWSHDLLSASRFSIEHIIGVSGLHNRNAAQLIHAIHDLFKSFDNHQTWKKPVEQIWKDDDPLKNYQVISLTTLRTQSLQGGGRRERLQGTIPFYFEWLHVKSMFLQLKKPRGTKLKVANTVSCVKRDRARCPFHHYSIFLGVSWQEHAVFDVPIHK